MRWDRCWAFQPNLRLLKIRQIDIYSALSSGRVEQVEYDSAIHFLFEDGSGFCVSPHQSISAELELTFEDKLILKLMQSMNLRERFI
jgi:hypothetical protein